MANRLFQSVIHQMKDSVDRTIGVVDENGVVISCSELVKIGEIRTGFRVEGIIDPETDTRVFGGYTYQPIGQDSGVEFFAFVEGEDKTAGVISKLLSVSLANIKSLYDEKHDRGSFIKNIILDNILPSDIYIKSKELHFNADEPRILYLVRFHDSLDFMPFEIIQNLFPDKSRDFIITVSEQEVVLVREAKTGAGAKEYEQVAVRIADTVSAEMFTKVSIGISGVTENIKDLASAYKEAQVALEVGKVFESEKNIISYDNLGIGRLIYQLPNTLCEMFLNEVFKKGGIESLDSETLETIQCFFENSLNVSETARKLFVHRNTLVYRLDKVKKVTGLDLRDFENSITFKVALMVKKYLSSKNDSRQFSRF